MESNPTFDRTTATTTRLVGLMILAALLHACAGEDGEQPTESVFGHKSNVFSAVNNWYVDEWWSANAAYFGGSAIAQQSTAIWLRRIGDIEQFSAGEVQGIPHLDSGDGPAEAFGLRQHLMAAEAQGNALVQLVLFNLPGRNCAAEMTQGELPASELPTSELGMQVYRVHFIDRVVKVLKDFPHLPVAMIIEPHSLPHMAIHHQQERCGAVDNRHAYGYVNGVRYAVNRMSELENVHIYLDAGSSNLFGWDDVLAQASLFMHGVIAGFGDPDEQVEPLMGVPEANGAQSGDNLDVANVFTEPPSDSAGGSHPPGYGRIDGFVTNVAEYVPLHEPYLGDPRAPEEDFPLRSAAFYDGNPRFDEWTYSADWLESLRGHGAETSDLGMLIDTSRNGWGQADRSLEIAPIQDPALVDSLRLDRRLHRGNWCNQPAGLGPRPQAQPADKPWIDAYVWVKPPGQSDGPADDYFDGNGHNYLRNPWCVPDNLIARPSSQLNTSIDMATGALPGGPFVTRWFETGFSTLIDNAWPPLCEGENDVCEEMSN